MKKNLNNKLTVDNRQLTMSIRTSRLFTFFLVVLFLLACTRNDTAHEHDTYTCPMHPTVISDKPGTCPVCGMELVRKARASEEVEITEDLSKLLRSPNEIVVGSIKTIKGEYKSLPVYVQAQGVVTYDTRKIHTIPARVGGRLEKIFLKYPFQPVAKGQKIAEVYSPELISAQRELVFLLENDSDNESLINGAKKKLELLGLSNSQINDLIRRKEATNTFSIYSQYSGYLITNPQTAPPTSVALPSSPGSSSGGMTDGMGATSSAQKAAAASPPGNSSGTIVREGDYVTAGQSLFTVVNSTALRIELDLPGAYSGSLREGSKVELDFGNGKKVAASVDFVQPFFTEGQEFLKLRVFTTETEGLHIGHLVDATITLESTESLWVPKEAVLDLGLQKVVFLKDRGVLKPKVVITGVSADGVIEIRDGLASSEEIAANAHYLVDSESFIRIRN